MDKLAAASREVQLGATLNLLPCSSLILRILSLFLHAAYFHFSIVLRHPQNNSSLQSQHLTLGSCKYSATVFCHKQIFPPIGWVPEHLCKSGNSKGEGHLAILLQ